LLALLWDFSGTWLLEEDSLRVVDLD